MIKCIMLIIAPFLASQGVVAQDVAFYSFHPVELQKALEKCPGTQPVGVSCNQLNDLGLRTNKLVSELQYNPQIFGQKILALQEAQAKLKKNLVGKSDVASQSSFDDNRMQLRERLAIVKWLESPRG